MIQNPYQTNLFESDAINIASLTALINLLQKQIAAEYLQTFPQAVLPLLKSLMTNTTQQSIRLYTLLLTAYSKSQLIQT